MLHLLIGPAGCGKSFSLREEMAALSAKGERVFCIVPEQYSFESERALYPYGVESVSFERLCDAVMRRCGGLAGEYAGETVQLLFMRQALRDLKGTLGAFQKVAARPDFAGEMLSTILELKRAGVTPDVLREASGEKEGEESLFRLKLRDLALIMESYNALISRSMIDPAGRLETVAGMIEESGFFKGTRVYIDEFKSFTAVQMKVIRLMLSQADEVTVSLCIDPEHKGTGLFETLLETRRALLSEAAKAGIAVASPKVMKGYRRFASEGIPALGVGVFAAAPIPAQSGGKVRGYILRDPYEEASFAAAEVKRLVREEGYAYREIALLARDLSTRAPSLEAAFDRYGMPYFLDGGRSVEAMPLTRFIRHLLQLMVRPLDREEGLMLLKCGVLPIDEEAVSAFEQYTYVWDLTGFSLRKPFTRSPSGFSEREMSERDAEKLALAESARKVLVGCWDRFREDCRKDGIAKGIYRFLTDEKIDAALQESCDRLMDEGEELDAENIRLSWDSLMEFLDAAETIRLGSSSPDAQPENDFAAFSELLSAAAAATPLVTRPQTLDSVFIGDPSQSRVGEVKVALILGCNEGIFPAAPSEGGTLREADRKQMQLLGLPIGGLTGERIADERFAVYKAVMTPSEQLILTCAAGEVDGSELTPSELMLGFSAVFPEEKPVRSREISPYFYCESLSTAFWQAARLPDGKKRRTLEALLSRDPVWKKRLQKLSESAGREERALHSPELARALFAPVTAPDGRAQTTVSPSQVEQFYSCPFAYFCRYGLSIRPPVKAELNPIARGSIVHFLLQKALSEKDFLTMDKEKILSLTDRLLAQYLDQALGGGEEKSGKFLYYFYRLRSSVAMILTALQGELSQTEFKICGLEETIAAGGMVQPLTIEDRDLIIRVQGKIDRLDAASLDGEEYVRVIDYKTGDKKFKLEDAERGLNLQMLLYLFAAKEGGQFQGAVPAGILYMPAGSKSPSFGRGEGDETSIRQLYRMNGLVLDEERVLRAMERDGAGGYITPPTPRGKKHARISREDLQALEEKTEELVRQMGRGLLEGKIAPDPQSTGARLPCSWCEYKSVCGK